jgi:hypothetical protein
MPSSFSPTPPSSASESLSPPQPDDYDVEPTSELKRQIKGEIEESMSSMLQDAENIRAAQQEKALIGFLDPEQPTLEYGKTVARIKELVEERYYLELKIARERNKLRLELVQVMKPSSSRHSFPSTTPPSCSSVTAEFELDEEWKEQLEGEMTSMAQAAKDTQMTELKSDRERLELEYQKVMKIADEQYQFVATKPNRERNQRRVRDPLMDPDWVRILHEEQEDNLEDNQDEPNGRYKPTPSSLSKGKQKEVLRKEEKPESREDSEEERIEDEEYDFILLEAMIFEEQVRPLQQPESRKCDEAFKLSQQQSHYRPREDEQQAQFRQCEKEIKRQCAEECITVSPFISIWSSPNSKPSTSPVTSSVLSNSVPKPIPQYNDASIWEKKLNSMSARITEAQAARLFSTKPAQVPARPPSTKPVGSRFVIPIPPKKIRLRDDHQNVRWVLNHMIHENLRSRRRAINSASTAGSCPSPMISGASDPITSDPPNSNNNPV